MPLSAVTPPGVDPTPIFEIFRGSYAAELLTAAVAHFNLFGRLAQQALAPAELGRALGLVERPMTVLLTALRSFGLLTSDEQGRVCLTELAREHLLPGGPFDVGDYVGLAANSPGVLEMVERLRTNKPASHASGVAFIYREGVASAMENEAAARHFTLALAGRAKNVAPVLAERVPLPSGGQAAARCRRRHRHLQHRLPAKASAPARHRSRPPRSPQSRSRDGRGPRRRGSLANATCRHVRRSVAQPPTSCCCRTSCTIGMCRSAGR